MTPDNSKTKMNKKEHIGVKRGS